MNSTKGQQAHSALLSPVRICAMLRLISPDAESR
jgi:hypothetical protein